MSDLLHELILRTSETHSDREALSHQGRALSYSQLAAEISKVASGLRALGLLRHERVATYVPKRFEAVTVLFGAAMAGGVFVPINPLLKAPQVGHILRDCNVRILVTAKARFNELRDTLAECHDLHTVILVDGQDDLPAGHAGLDVVGWGAWLDSGGNLEPHRIIDTDMAAILYTSGSTGKPKGVVLSHRNVVTGGKSVARYLENRSSDRVLAVLPLSFDYGFSQLSTAFASGACTVLMDYLLPRDVVNAVAKESITGLAGVPPLWVQLAQMTWPESARSSLRYITNSGGAMPRKTLGLLRAALPQTRVFLMYGLTEAFRSTYLPPEELDRRPESMGKAIPNAEIYVVREDGSACAPGEPGELVHRGSLVALGYWNDPVKTAERFKPAPVTESGLVLPEIAVWSGDTVRMDDEGYLYFVGRRDDMIKTSGYRVSPTEIEEVFYATGRVTEAAAVGVAHPTLGQAVVVVAVPRQSDQDETEAVLEECRRKLPNFMVPAQIVWQSSLPRNPNGKIDRKTLAIELQGLFQENTA